MENLPVTIIGAVVGSIVSLIIPFLLQVRRNGSRRDLVGQWKSSYLLETQAEWVDEDVMIALKLSGFRIISERSTYKTNYQAKTVLRNSEMVGTWRAIKGQARGSVLLAVRPSGDLLYGYYTGSREDGARVFAPWVLGRTELDIAAGKKLLATQTLKIGQWETIRTGPAPANPEPMGSGLLS